MPLLLFLLNEGVDAGLRNVFARDVLRTIVSGRELVGRKIGGDEGWDRG